MQRIAIIGGGITGLTCAYRLARDGHEVTVYERNAETGGLASSFESNGFVFDYGPHEFCTDNPALVETLQELLGDDLLLRHKHAAQYFQGKFVDYPLAPLEIVRQLPAKLIARIVREVVFQRLKSTVYTFSDHSFEHWVANRFGETLYKTYFGPYTRKVWGIEPDKLDPRTASSRISFNSIFDYLLKSLSYYLFGKNDFSSIHSPLKDSFYYTRGGIGTLTTRLAEGCKAAGVVFERCSDLVRIETDGEAARALIFADGRIDDTFDFVVSTIPVTSLLESLGHRTDQVNIDFRSMVLVFLEVPQERVSPYSWAYFPDPDISFQRTTEFSHFDAEMNPEGATGLCLEISCFPEDEVWRASDAEIEDRIRAELERVGMLDRDVPCKAHIIRKKFVYPIQFIGHVETVEKILEPVRSLSNVVTTGRQGLYKYCNMNECMEMAFDVADQISKKSDTFTYDLVGKWKGAGLEGERTLQLPLSPPGRNGVKV